MDGPSLPGDPAPQPAAPGLVVLFDGVCNLCNGSVQFIIKRDPEGKFRFASLQSSAGQELVRKAGLPAFGPGSSGLPASPAPGSSDPDPGSPGLNSFVLLENGKAYTRSAAALRVLKHLGGGWKLVYALGIIVPPFIRNGIYNWTARNRYRWFGRQDACWIPTPGLKERFLD